MKYFTTLISISLLSLLISDGQSAPYSGEPTPPATEIRQTSIDVPAPLPELPDVKESNTDILGGILVDPIKLLQFPL